MRISILVPCYNEEKNIRKSIGSWLTQTRTADEILVINDSSTDGTEAILQEYAHTIKILRTPRNLGNKSYAQEFGLPFVTGDIMVMTDGDTVLDAEFLARIEEDLADPSVAAVGGYVKSIPYNMLTACRALDYIVGQNIDKVAQESLDFLFVIPGAAAAFRTDIFRRHIRFDHDTVTEDLDFTYKFHESGLRILYDRRAICYTQDPSDLGSYVNQMRRWYAGGWQNLIKHFQVPRKPGMALELSLMYIEGLIFSLLLLVMPFINLYFTLISIGIYACILSCLILYAAAKERRADILAVLPLYIVMRFVHAWIYVEQFIKEVLLGYRDMNWKGPQRVTI